MHRLDAVAALIQEEQEAILAEWRRRVHGMPRAQNLDRLTLEDGIRPFLDQLSTALMQTVDRGKIPSRMELGPAEHGMQRYALGFQVEQVVFEYGMLRQAILHWSEQHGIHLDGLPRQVLHQILDEAIGDAVRTFSAAQKSETDRRVQERLSMIVHDLKTPLAAIHTASLLLEGRLSPEAKEAVHTILSIILRNCDNLNVMLMKLLEHASRDEMVLHSDLTRMDCEFRSLVSQVAEALRPLAQKTGVPIINNAPLGLTVNVDAFLMKQALQNLISNALKYTDKGEITIGAVETQYQTTFWVNDSGVGISAERLPDLFERREVDPLKSESTGLGLSIVKRIVEAHHGAIVVESELGKGSTFKVTLPHHT
jgi:signal transduction histidine kinase